MDDYSLKKNIRRKMSLFKTRQNLNLVIRNTSLAFQLKMNLDIFYWNFCLKSFVKKCYK